MSYIKLGRISLLLINLLFCSACVKAQRKASVERESQSPNAATVQPTPNVKDDQLKGSKQPQDDMASRGQRIAVPEIEGCPRDNITFFRGEVRSFKRTTDAIKITIHTDWDSDEELTQPTSKDHVVVYQLGGKQMGEDDWGLIVSEGGAIKPNVRATVWVCERDGEKIIKIINWHLSRSSIEGSPGEGTPAQGVV